MDFFTASMNRRSLQLGLLVAALAGAGAYLVHDLWQLTESETKKSPPTEVANAQAMSGEVDRRLGSDPTAVAPQDGGVGQGSTRTDEDVYRLITALAKEAYEGSAVAQLRIAKAMMTCVHTPTAIDLGTLPQQEAQRIQRDIVLCERYWSEDPFGDLPPTERNPKYVYTYEYWIRRAADAALPQALAIDALLSIHGTPGETLGDARARAQRQMERAIRAKDPEVYLYVGTTLSVENLENRFDARSAAWLMLGCRQGACEEPTIPMLSVPCPQGMGNNCTQRSAIEFTLQRELGPEYARAVALSYELQNAIEREDWLAIDLTL